MKRKQKLPRRTRRQTPVNPSGNTDVFTSPYNDTGNLGKTEESKIEEKSNNLDVEKGKPPCETNKFENGNGVCPQQSFFNSETSFLSQLKGVEKKPRETQIKSKLGNISANAAKSNLKRPIDDTALSVTLEKKPAAFGNFRNESEDDEMPVILNVFTLSQLPTSYIKHKTANIMHENNFPVTPPSSPPFQSENTTRFSSGNWKTKQALKEHVTISNVHNIYKLPVRHDRQNITNGCPAAMNHYMHQTSYIVEEQTKRCCTISNGDCVQATVESRIPYARKFAPSGFVQEGSKLLSRSTSQKEHDIFIATEAPDLCVYSEFPQDGGGKHFSNLEISRIANRKYRKIDQSGLQSLPTSTNNTIYSNKLGLPLNLTDKTGNNSSNILPEGTLTCTASYTTTQPMNGNKTVKSHVFLSPRDFKVQELKKRLQEQEEALNKLRKIHYD